jgi:hypothetical protein
MGKRSVWSVKNDTKYERIWKVSTRTIITKYVNMSLQNCLDGVLNTHWDFLPKFLSLHYYTTLGNVLGVQRSEQAQGTTICLFGLLFFSQNGMTFKKPTKIVKI